MLTHLADPHRRPSRVLILGKSGFVARYLIPELQKTGVVVEALGRPELDLAVPSSVSTLSQVLRPDDTVVILSALTPDKGRDFRTLMTNLRMAENLCEVFDRCSCAHVIYISSDAVYDGCEIPIDESSNRQPADLYALMHTSREMMLQSVLGSRSIPLCILRPVAVFGPGDTHNSYGPNRFVRDAFLHKAITLFGKGEDERSHLYIQDAVRLIHSCVGKVTTGVLNLAPPETVTFRHVAEMVTRLLPFEVEVKYKGMPGSDAVSRRPYRGRLLEATIPDFAFTPMRDALRAYVDHQENAGERDR